VQAVERLINAGIDVRLIIIGGGPLWNKIRKQSLNLPIDMLGYIANRKHVATYLASADVAIAPGPLETFCLSALESLASGTPVVASKSGAVGEILNVTAPDAAGAVATDDGQAFAVAINDLLRNSSLRSQARKQAEKFSWCKTVEQMLQLHGDQLAQPNIKPRLKVA
jgi:alpha-1,6-mannosyltransferase